MRHFAFAVCALALSARAVLAADAARPFYLLSGEDAPRDNWSGSYVGINGGWIGSSHNAVTNSATDSTSGGLGGALSAGAIPGHLGIEHRGFIGGGQIGYNWQIEPKFVWGIEADFDGIAKGSSDTVYSFPGSSAFVPVNTVYNATMDSLGTVRARVGYLPSKDILWYATGGVAFSNTKVGSAFYCPACKPPPFAPATVLQTSIISAGWTAGGGVEWRFAPSLSVKAEYLYVDLGSQSNVITYAYGSNTSTLTSFFSEHDNVLRVGLNYRLF
jgi:outer membrane immunogenic protein